jgi:hypothetical protein
MFDLDSVIKDGIRTIAAEQRKDGDFTSLSSFHPTNFTDAVAYSTTFFTSIILECLNGVAESKNYRPLVDSIRVKAATFLLAEKNEGWSFNYWARTSVERETMPYPDDLDDTFSALAALAHYDASIMNGAALAAVVNILTRAETKEGGPYRTWLVAAAEEPWADVDVAINSTVGYFLSRIGVHLPNVEKFK